LQSVFCGHDGRGTSTTRLKHGKSGISAEWCAWPAAFMPIGDYARRLCGIDGRPGENAEMN
jgi:hypothetical protein